MIAFVKSVANARMITVFIFFLFASASSARQSVLNNSDYEALLNLLKQSLQVEQDIMDSYHSLQTKALSDLREALSEQNCYQPLIETAESMSEQLSSLSALVGISTEMRLEADEGIVNREIKSAASSFLKRLQISRTHLNRSAGLCSTYAIVVAKGQQIISVGERATTIVQSILRRL
jgi:hypothetical protein